MNYDFETVINRVNTNSLKYDFAAERGKPSGLLPFWVADMDFAAPPEVLANLQNVVAHGVFGYTEAKGDYYDALTNWFSSRFGYAFTGADVVKTPGVVFALAQAIRAFTAPADHIIVQTPVYYPFYDLVLSNGRKLVKNPLAYENGRYSIDFIGFEQKIIEHRVKMFLLCSPHNPIGRVWTRGELERLNGICQKHGVIVFSDEIHCDFVYPGHVHTCFGLLNENAIIATAPSKTFNLAGLQLSNVVIKNAAMRKKLKDEIARTGYSQLNAIGIAACQSAYTHGGEWLSELKIYLLENIRLTKRFLSERLPKIRLVEPEGTYLLWLDFSTYGLSPDALDRRITEGAKLWLDGGSMFGSEGEGFQRINIACPRATLLAALERLEAEFAA